MSVTSSVWSSLTLPVIIGAEPEGDNPPKEEVKPQDQSGAGGAGNPPNDPPKDDDSDGDNGDPQKKITAQDEIIARKQKALEDAEAELQELRDFKSEAEKAKLSAEEKAEQEAEELKTRNQTLESSVQSLVLENAFLTANDYNWHNPAAALKLTDLSDVEIAEKDGKFSVKDIQKLKDALKKTAEENPYLVKAAEEQWSGKTGDPGKRRQSNQGTAERTRLRDKYPALRNK